MNLPCVWLFVPNGFLDGFQEMRRDLLLEVEPSLFHGIAGSTDSELLLHLALTFGLEEGPVGATERAVGSSSPLGASAESRIPSRCGRNQRR